MRQPPTSLQTWPWRLCIFWGMWFGELFGTYLWKEIPLTGQIGRTQQKCKTLKIDFPGYLCREASAFSRYLIFFKFLCHLWCHKIFVRHLALLPDPEKTSRWQGGFKPIITIKSDSDKRYINNHYLQKGSGSFGSGQGPSWYKPRLCPTWQFLKLEALFNLMVKTKH